jgi:signal transduction histidine kinase
MMLPEAATNVCDNPVYSIDTLGGRAEAKEQFLAILAHELRTPLTAILASLEVLRRRSADGPTAERTRGIVERQARNMGRLIDDLLDVSRIDRGKVQLCKRPLDLVPAVVEAVESVSSLIEERHHHLEVVLPPEPLYVDADPMRLEQIVANLLTNAVRYTEPGGYIWLMVEHGHGEAVLRVRDTGIGIAPDILASIFELFVQEKNGSQGGLGVGLHLVRSLVRLHGGTVTAASAGPGKGSEFVVRLPLRAGPCQQECQTEEDNAPVSESHGALRAKEQFRLAHWPKDEKFQLADMTRQRSGRSKSNPKI